MFSQNLKIPYSKLYAFYSEDSLYNHYTSSFENVQDFFDYDYRDLDLFSEVINHSNISLDQRKELYNVLVPYNKECNYSPKVMSNLESLLSDNTFTVFTGQ